MPEDYRYVVKVVELDKPMKVSKEIQDSLKGVASGKMLAKMKREAVDCPVLNRRVPFLECFACKNFQRRFKGEVQCIGDPL